MAIGKVKPLDFLWPTRDPFLFCVHHDDRYPAANADLGPAASLAGRNIGMDFEVRDGWRMYHGDTVPGFPSHPHRGFETVTVAREGFIDHCDSLGAAGRYGQGDVQWMTAGEGIVHSEMFPLLNRNDENRTELFQIWLNLPAANKMVPPHFEMLWNEDIPRRTFFDEQGHPIDVTVMAGALEGVGKPLSPPPNSWASDPTAHVAIWTVRLAPGAQWELPRAEDGVNRTLYFFKGGAMRIAGEEFNSGVAIELGNAEAIALDNGGVESEMLLLQGRPIGEPVAQQGPFVMNTRAELMQAMRDYQTTRFGGWPWPKSDPVHGPEPKRFARYPNGKTKTPSRG